MSSERVLQQLEGKAYVLGKEKLQNNEIPSVSVWGETLPEAWENAVLATWEFGANIPTEYDQPVDPESRDVTMQMTIAKPLTEPRIHKSMPDSYEGLGTYVAEVVEGVHDYKVDRSGLAAGWSYSYHDRLFNYPGRESWQEIFGREIAIPNVDQIANLIDKLAEAPYTRRAQAITWVPQLDQPNHEPPCLQRVWFRIIKTDEGKNVLQMNTNWRSNDVLKATFMNTYGLTELQRWMAEQVSQKMEQEVSVGRYVATMDSLHIYGSYVRKGDMEKFLHQIETMPFSKRVIGSDHPYIVKSFAQAREKLAKETH